MWILHFWGYNWTFWTILAKTNNFWFLWQFLVTNYKLVALIVFIQSWKNWIVTWKKKIPKENMDLPFVLILA